MATRTIKPKRDDSMLNDWQSLPEQAPSAMREGSSPAAPLLFFVGFFLCLVGGLALTAPLFGWGYFIRPGWGFFSLTIGLALLLTHCFLEPEQQLRRLYGMAGFGFIFAAAAIRVWPFKDGTGAYFLPIGVPCLILGFLFVIGVARRETNAWWATMSSRVLLLGGAVMIAAALLFSHRDPAYLTSEGVLLFLVGLLYLCGFIGLHDERSGDAGYFTGLAVGTIGGINLVAALARSWFGAEFLVPYGLILIAVSVLYLLVSLAVCSDRPVIVLMRRELLAYFYSPIAYLVIYGLLVIFSFHFRIFLFILTDGRGQVLEPIVQDYVYSLFPVVAIIVMVPILTMRLFSEESRTGSLEVLLTAPVNESTLVLGKFFASLIFFLIAWSPFFAFLIAMRVFGGEEFDYRPVLSFFLALTVTGAGFLAMGLFFSSLTANQIIAAVLTFAGMLLHLGFHWLRGMNPTGALNEFFTYISFLDLWSESSRGFLAPRFLVFHASLAVFFLYLTNLVLSARKWK